MDFDERLDRIAHRHEALAQTVELMARIAHSHENRITNLEDRRQ